KVTPLMRTRDRWSLPLVNWRRMPTITGYADRAATGEFDDYASTHVCPSQSWTGFVACMACTPYCDLMMEARAMARRCRQLGCCPRRDVHLPCRLSCRCATVAPIVTLGLLPTLGLIARLGPDEQTPLRAANQMQSARLGRAGALRVRGVRRINLN